MPMIMASKKCSKRCDCMGIIFSTVIKIHKKCAILLIMIFHGCDRPTTFSFQAVHSKYVMFLLFTKLIWDEIQRQSRRTEF